MEKKHGIIPLDNYRGTSKHFISGVCVTYCKFPEGTAFQMKRSIDTPTSHHSRTSSIQGSWATCWSVHWPQSSIQVQYNPFVKELELHIRLTASNLAPDNRIHCHYTQHWFGSCLKLNTKSTVLEGIHGNIIHWTSHVMMANHPCQTLCQSVQRF